MSNKFDSEGFDLSSTDDDTNVIYELGGGITTPSPPASATAAAAPPPQPTAESERLKELGNSHFRQGKPLDAYDYYTDAIEAAPYGDDIGPKGEELLRLKDEFDEEVRQANAERHRVEMEQRRTTKDETKENNAADMKPNKNPEFVPPKHLYGHKLAIYYANRAATTLQMNRLEETIEDCTIATLYNPMYVKAYLRRSTAYERNGDTESALLDMRRAYELEPTNITTKKQLDRLEKIEKERLEKLKEETMAKLKDLGNSILGNFGLSLDNFQAVQDPKSGGYSISFNQNK